MTSKKEVSKMAENLLTGTLDITCRKCCCITSFLNNKEEGFIYRCYECNEFLAEKGKSETQEAKRTPINVRYDLIPPTVLKAVAEVFAHGANKYGDYNWQKSRLSEDKSPINHALKHIVNYQAGIPDDESTDPKTHLSHAIVNLMFEYWYEENMINPKGKV